MKVREHLKTTTRFDLNDELISGEKNLPPVKVFSLSRRDYTELKKAVSAYSLSVFELDLNFVDTDLVARLNTRCKDTIEYGAGWPGVVKLLDRLIGFQRDPD